MSGKQPIQVLVVESFEIMQQGLRHILSNAAGIQVIGEAASVESALDLCAVCHPDVVLIDTSLPDMQGFSAVQAIHAAYAHLQLIVLAGPDDYPLLDAVMQSNVTGYLTRNVSANELIRAIHLAAAYKPVMIRYSQNRHERKEGLAEHLTQREQQVLTLLTHGLTNRQIAADLQVSQFTVKNHVSNVLNKLGATSRTEAAMLALQHSLVPMD